MSTKKALSHDESTAIAEIVHEGEKLILPKEMSLDRAIALLNSRREYESKSVVVREMFDVFPLDGACALDTVLQRRYGWAPAIKTPGFFRDNPPSLMSVEVGPDQVRQVPWGAFLLPNVEGRIITTTATKDSRQVFAVHADILRRDEAVIRALFDELRAETRNNSIYRGKAIKLRFKDDDGDLLEMPEPKFLRVEDIDANMLVYSDSVYRQIATNLFVPITRAHDCIKNGIPLKRGVLLGGNYGTGKTLAAAVASKLAVQTGITYVYVPRADELANAIEFAKQYQSPACVVFCEDIDRVMGGGRSVEIDDILNTIDGIDSKTTNIIVVLTTNALTGINPAMLRPGRLDAVIEVTEPDAGAVERLVRAYGGTSISPSTDLKRVGVELAGNIPAVIAEVVKRAKLAQLALQDTGTAVEMLSEQALLDAAQTIRAQVHLLGSVSGKPDDAPASLDTALTRAVQGALNGEGKLLQDMSARLRRVEDAVV
ncbi:MAG: AAA family ATPase [Steroidobacteraceae bacterium]